MSRFEVEAREVLLRRRRAITDSALPGGDPAARWDDHEEAEQPRSEFARRELAEIDAALARIREGSFGVCLRCSGPLGLQRLRALPEARYCLACSGRSPLR